MAKIIHDSETSAIGKQVIVACAFIHHQFHGVDKVFLAQRAPSKKFLPGVFEVPGGHIDFGEDIIAGLQRELREELGKDIIVGDPFSVFTYMNEIKGAHAVEVCYFARFADQLTDVKLEPADHVDWGWFAEADEPLYAVNRKADDRELAVIRQGFAILRGKKLRT